MQGSSQDQSSTQQQEKALDKYHDKAIDALLNEYTCLRTEIVAIEGSIHQLALSSLAAIGAIATLVVTLVSSSPALLASVLLLLPLPFSAMVLAYLGQVGTMITMSNYIHQSLSPEFTTVHFLAQSYSVIWNATGISLSSFKKCSSKRRPN